MQVTHRYTGQEADSSTGLYYYHARYYDPSLGRFLQPDWVTSDHYMYARHNPILYTDPTGHVATRYTPGFWSYEYNTPPKQGADTSLPNPALTLPPSWATPAGMELGPMSGGSDAGLSFSLHESRVIGQAGPNQQGGTMTIEQFNGMMSGNDAIARFVYSQGQYAGLFSPDDVAAMTWDHGRFWNVKADINIKGVIQEGELIPDTSWLDAQNQRLTEMSEALYEKNLQARIDALYAMNIYAPCGAACPSSPDFLIGGPWGAIGGIFTGSKITNELARTLGISRQDLGKRIESIKKAWGLGGADNVNIDTVTGDVFDRRTNEAIGNLFDERPNK